VNMKIISNVGNNITEILFTVNLFYLSISFDLTSRTLVLICGLGNRG
jgi:hypothetical protein